MRVRGGRGWGGLALALGLGREGAVEGRDVSGLVLGGGRWVLVTVFFGWRGGGVEALYGLCLGWVPVAVWVF